MFEKAVREKVRFNYHGLCSVEDLWDLSVEVLDLIFKNLNAKLREQKEESLLETKSNADSILELKVDIVKHIVKVKLEEQKVEENKVLKAQRKQELLRIIADKQNENLRNMPIDDLTKMVDEL